ncbi:MAG: DUF4307 domain-containing protein [Lacisediminihabitans sp.]
MTATGHTPASVASATLDARYGRSAGKRRRDRWIAVAVAVFVALVVGSWVIWAGLDLAGGGLDSDDIGHKIINDRSVSVNYQVTMPPGSTASCALEVENEAHAIVGWKIVDIAPSTKATRVFSDVVRSSELGVTGLIYRCWLT